MPSFHDYETEDVKCPSCQAVLSLYLESNVSAELRYDGTRRRPYMNEEKQIEKTILGKYTKRLPNIGLLSAFFAAHCGDNKFQCNGHFALKGIDHLELPKAMGRGDESVCLGKVLDRFNKGDVQEVFPDEMTSAFVRVMGGTFDKIFRRAELDFLYAIYPDAKLYACEGFDGLMAKSGDDVCAFTMSMRLADPNGNPWQQTESGETAA